MIGCKLVQKRDVVIPGGCVVKTQDILHLPFSKLHAPREQLPRLGDAEKECLYKHWNSKYATTDRRTLGITRSPSGEFSGFPHSPAPKPPRTAPVSRPNSKASSRASSQQDFRSSSRPASQQDQYRPGSVQDFRPKSGPSRPGSRQDSVRSGSGRLQDGSRAAWGVAPASAQGIQINGTVSPFSEQGYRPASSLADFLKTSPKPPTAHKTKPNKVWAYKVPETTAHLLQNNKSQNCNPHNSHVHFQSPTPSSRSTPERPCTPEVTFWHEQKLCRLSPTESERAQSAELVRTKVTSDSRKVKSAGRHRSTATPLPPHSSTKTKHEKEREATEKSATAAGAVTLSNSEDDLTEPAGAPDDVAAAAGVSSDDDDGALSDGEESPVLEDLAAAGAVDVKLEEEAPRVPSPPPVDYDEQLEKYGWRMQVHGDPLGLKTPCLPKRSPYTVACRVQEPRPDPPKVHAENYDTFFLNTIPRHPMSFDIHPDFMSEVLQAKRYELQKRDGGVAYRYKNFSFVY